MILERQEPLVGRDGEDLLAGHRVHRGAGLRHGEPEHLRGDRVERLRGLPLRRVVVRGRSGGVGCRTFRGRRRTRGSGTHLEPLRGLVLRLALLVAADVCAGGLVGGGLVRDGLVGGRLIGCLDSGGLVSRRVVSTLASHSLVGRNLVACCRVLRLLTVRGLRRDERCLGLRVSRLRVRDLRVRDLRVRHLLSPERLIGRTVIRRRRVCCQ